MVYHVAGYHNVDPAIFLDMTMVDMHLYLSGKADKKRDKAEYEFRVSDTLNHLLGQYIYFAVNEANKYPKQPYSKFIETSPKDEQTNEQLAIALQAWMGVLGGEEAVHVKTDND